MCVFTALSLTCGGGDGLAWFGRAGAGLRARGGHLHLLGLLLPRLLAAPLLVPPPPLLPPPLDLGVVVGEGAATLAVEVVHEDIFLLLLDNLDVIILVFHRRGGGGEQWRLFPRRVRKF